MPFQCRMLGSGKSPGWTGAQLSALAGGAATAVIPTPTVTAETAAASAAIIERMAWREGCRVLGAGGDIVLLVGTRLRQFGIRLRPNARIPYRHVNECPLDQGVENGINPGSRKAPP